MIDLNRIWKEQNVYDSFAYEINRVGKMADIFINDSKGVIATENAKKEDTWKRFKELDYIFSKGFLDDLINIEILKKEMETAQKSVKGDSKISLEIEIFNLAQSENKQYWNRLLDEGLMRKIITFSEESVIKNYILELAKSNPQRIPNETHYKIAWTVRKRLEDKGVLV
jgi:sugar-specific transcriptional regulator TrmB